MRAPKLILALLISAILMGACTLFVGPAPTPTTDINQIQTQAAQTVVAQLTQSAPQATTTATLGVPTETTPPTATATQSPTNTPEPTSTNTPTPTATNPPPTPTPQPCNWATFVRDVTVPDNSVMLPGSDFTKTWRLENIGTCNWTSGYDLVWVDGERMGAPRSVPLPETVRPGEEVNLSVNMVAPNVPGTYRSHWMLRSVTGEVFGLGSDQENDFWVQIRVPRTNPDYGYDFVSFMCDAVWESGAGRLNCPGREGNEDGYMVILDRPQLEDGRSENEPAILVGPEDVRNGYIEAVFPPIRVEEGDRIRTGIMCAFNADRCNLIFQLDYQIGNGPIRNLGIWRESHDDNFAIIDIDISDLADENVKFIFTVEADGNPRDARGLWWAPHIIR